MLSLIYFLLITILFPLQIKSENCSKSSVLVSLPSGLPYTKKIFTNCQYLYGELAEFINKRHDEMAVNCYSLTEKLKTTLEPGQTMYLNVYREPLKSLEWTCNLRNNYSESAFFHPFQDYYNKESFKYELQYSGVYDLSPRFVIAWL